MPGPAHQNGREGWCNCYVVDGDEMFMLSSHAPSPSNAAEEASDSGDVAWFFDVAGLLRTRAETSCV